MGQTDRQTEERTLELFMDLDVHTMRAESTTGRSLLCDAIQ